jgi:mannosylglycerate hydrolase
MSKSDEKIFHVISNTHWDREWRYPFQQNRQMLVDMIDKVLEILEADPGYKAFHLDNQSVVIKDYLEVRPHKEEQIRKFVEDRRLFIGPWYVLPEQFQVGGENLIRNLLLGHKLSKKYGRVSKTGYSPFSWGQISQLPQIYKEFDIELIMFYRGINSIESPKAEFLWIGADGTEAVSSRFSTMPRYNFYFYIYRPVIHNEFPSDVEYKWSKGGVPFRLSGSQSEERDYFMAETADGYYPENIEKQVEAIINDQADDFTTPHIIWMEGHDSSGPNIKTVKILNDIKKILPGLNVIHSTLEDYTKEVLNSIDISRLKKVYGERRSAQYDRRSGNLYGYTTSARMYLKQKNFEAERWLQFYAEPFSMFSSLSGRDIKDKYLETAWDLVIQNSSHDSIGGCSLDDIHDDMMNRYKQSIEISKGVYENSLKHIVRNINLSNYKNDNLFLTLINPNNYTRSEITECFIDIPKEYDKGNFKLFNSNEEEIGKEILDSYPYKPVLEQMTDRPMYFDMVRYRCLLYAKEIPAFGYHTMIIRPSDNTIENNKRIASRKNNKIQLENENLKIRINGNGTFNLFDKINNKEFNNIGYFYDEGEGGHAWVNIPVKPFITTLKSKPNIKITLNNAYSASVKISHKIRIPANLKERRKRLPVFITIPVDLYITLNKESRLAELKIEVDNKAESHRLRVMFPSLPEAEYHYGEGQFDVVRRAIARPDTKNWIEQPMYDYPLHHFMDITDEKHGLAVIVEGLKEYEVQSDHKKTVALTLLRGFEYIIAPSSKQDYNHLKGSQCPGKSSYRMAIYPHKGNWQEGQVYTEALNFNNKLTSVQTGRTRGNMPAIHSFLEILPDDLVFSAFKKAEDENGFVLRVYNPGEREISGEVRLSDNIKRVEQVTMEEKFIAECRVYKNSFKVSLAKKKIGTYKIFF